MSRCYMNEQRCEVCGLAYKSFRTGLTYSDVYLLLWGGPDPKTWKYKRRHTVLGLWHSLKKQMWAEHLYECTQQAIENEKLPEGAALQSLLENYEKAKENDVPF